MKKLRALICVLLCVALCAALIPVSAKESKVLTVLGDSVCSGYDLNEEGPAYYFMHRNYYCSDERSWPVVLGKTIDADTVYNDGTASFWSTDFIKALLDPAYTTDGLLSLAAAYDPDSYAGEENAERALRDHQYHSLLLATLKQADTVAVQMGGNDIMSGFLRRDIAAMAKDESGNIRNPLAYALAQMIATADQFERFLASDKSLLTAFTDALRSCGKPVTMADITELLTFLKLDNIYARCEYYADQAGDSYRELTAILRDGVELTQAQYDAILAAYAAADALVPAASTDKTGGKLSEKEILTEGRLSVYEEGGSYFAAPVNPAAELVFVGFSNPYSSTYYYTLCDYAEIFSFTRRCLSLVSSALKNEGTEGTALSASFKTLLEQTPFALLHSTLGKLEEEPISLLNTAIAAAAKDCGVPYADVSGVPGARKLDVHPDAAGHKKIAAIVAEALAAPEEEPQEEPCKPCWPCWPCTASNYKEPKWTKSYFSFANPFSVADSLTPQYTRTGGAFLYSTAPNVSRSPLQIFPAPLFREADKYTGPVGLIVAPGFSLHGSTAAPADPTFAIPALRPAAIAPVILDRSADEFRLPYRTTGLWPLSSGANQSASNAYRRQSAVAYHRLVALGGSQQNDYTGSPVLRPATAFLAPFTVNGTDYLNYNPALRSRTTVTPDNGGFATGGGVFVNAPGIHISSLSPRAGLMHDIRSLSDANTAAKTKNYTNLSASPFRITILVRGSSRLRFPNLLGASPFRITILVR